MLVDVARTMFDKHYVDKLFAPQELYPMSSVRKIFDRLAHSSIMRLSESRSAGPSAPAYTLHAACMVEVNRHMIAHMVQEGCLRV